MTNPWFRMYHEFATDQKVQMLSEADQRRYVMILCLRCCNVDVTLQDEEVAFLLRISSEEWNKTKATLVGKRLINEDNKPTAWDKRQYVSDSSTSRVAKYRAKKKRQCNVTVTPPDTDTDTDTDTSINIYPPKKTTKSVKKKRPIKTTLPNDFSVSHEVLVWYQKNGYQEDIDQHLENFKDKCKAKGYTYADFDSAFKDAIRNDWAGLRTQKSQSMTGQGNNSGSNKSRQNYDRKHRINRDDILSTDF